VRGVGTVVLVLARMVLGLARMDGRELLRGLVQFRLWLASAGDGGADGATVVVQMALYVERFGARALLR